MIVPSPSSISRDLPTPAAALGGHMRLQDIIHLSGIDGCGRKKIWILRNEHREIARIGGADPVRTFDERRIQRNEIHEHAKAQFLAEKFRRNLQFRIFQVHG